MMAMATIPALFARRAFSTQSSTGKNVAMALTSNLAPFTNPAEKETRAAVVLTRGEGVYVWDNEGKKYLDGLAGLWSNALGNGNERIIEACHTQMKKLAYQHTFWNRTTDIAEEYSSRLVDFASHKGVKQVFMSCGGSDANDTNVKLAWYYWNAVGQPTRKTVIARNQAYHGVTITASSMSGLSTIHKGYGPLPLPWVRHVSTPHYWKHGLPGETEEEYSSRLAKELEDLILREGPETIAAFIAEPVMGAGGVIPPPKGYFQKIQPVLKKYDILFILDEVITAFGRLGERFGSDFYDISPDLYTVAKVSPTPPPRLRHARGASLTPILSHSLPAFLIGTSFHRPCLPATILWARPLSLRRLPRPSRVRPTISASSAMGTLTAATPSLAPLAWSASTSTRRHRFGTTSSY